MLIRITLNQTLDKTLVELDDRKTMSNYRLTSMLTNFYKIFEKIIKLKLNSYLKKLTPI